jgi:hypothetical protein
MSAVSLGQQFNAIATGGDRVPLKNPEGKTYREILPELEDYFEPQQHSEFKTGYDKKTQKDTFYCYVKWQHIRKRLDEVAGRDGWIVERTGMFLDESGMPVLIGRMNILGVVKEAMGYGKAHEKWQGTRIENAEADLMKNCAEAHGVCRYLDDQRQTIQYLWDNAGGDEYIKSMARKLGVQYSLKFQSEIRENNSISSGVATPTRQQRPLRTKKEEGGLLEAMSAEPEPDYSLYPQHDTDATRIRQLIGYSREDVVRLCKKRNATAPRNLPPQIMEGLLKEMVLDWAKDKFNDPAKATTSLTNKIAVLSAAGNTRVVDAIASWIESVQSPARC